MTFNFDSFRSHTKTMEIWEDWQKSGKFDGLVVPKSFTSSMVAAIQAIDVGNIKVLSFALNSAKTFTTENATGKERIDFIVSYAKKVGFPIAIYMV